MSTVAIAKTMDAYVAGQEIASRNLANVATPGFKRNIAMMEQEGPALDLSQGSLRLTHNDLDVAIQGEGFFTVSRDGEMRYTRDGTFRINENRMLVTQMGHPVLGEGGEVQIPQNEGPITINAAGEIRAGETVVGKLQVTAFDNPENLRQAGDNELRDLGAEPRAARDFQVQQGAIEGSNVNPVNELVRMMSSYRDYESCARSMRSLEEAASKLYAWARG